MLPQVVCNRRWQEWSRSILAAVCRFGTKSMEKKKLSGSSTPTEAGYFREVHFIECGKNADSRFLMQNLWKDLGYSSVADSKEEPPDVANPGERAGTPDQQRKSEVQYTKRKMMARLKSRGKMLIILENVWEQDVIEDLHISLQHIRYLITSQNSDIWPDVIRRVSVAIPTVEEARRILANHIPGWDLNESFPLEVQEEVDALLEEVKREPLILASVASSVRITSEAKKPELWKSLRRNLMVYLTDLQNAKSKPMTFGESYKTNVAAAMTMAVNGFLPHAQTLLFLVVLFTENVPDIEVPVLQVLFQAYHGRNSLIHVHSFHQLKASSFISVNETVLPWRKQTFTRWSIHDLRRRFLGRMEQIDVVKQKLLSEPERDPDEDEDEQHLSMVLCYLYGNQHCREQAKQRLAKSEFSICKQLQRGKGDEFWLDGFAFVRSWVVLLSPEHYEDREKEKHDAAKKVILHLMKFGELHDGQVANLLKHPHTRLDTCHVLSSWKSTGTFRTSIPITSEILLTTVKQSAKDVPLSELRVLTSSLCSLFWITYENDRLHEQNSDRMLDILRTFGEMLADDTNLQIQIQVSEFIQKISCVYNAYGNILACSKLIEVLVSLIDIKTSISIFRSTTWTFVYIFSHGMQNVEDVLISSLTEVVIEKYSVILSQETHNDFRILSLRALQMIDLGETTIMKFVRGELQPLSYLPLFHKLNTPWELLVLGKFFCRILVVSEGMDVRLDTEVRKNLIAGVVKSFVQILRAVVISEIRIAAGLQLALLSQIEDARRILVADKRVIDCVHELLRNDVSLFTLDMATQAVYNIYFTETQFELEDETSSTCLTKILEIYERLLDRDIKQELREEAVRGLGKFAGRQEVRKRLMAIPHFQERLEGLLRTKEDVSSSFLRGVADILFSFVVKGEEKDIKNDLHSSLVGKALDSFSDLLMGDFQADLQSEAIRGLGLLASRQDIRERIVLKYQGALKRSVELLRETATTLTVVNVRDSVLLVSSNDANSQNLDSNTAEYRTLALRGYLALLGEGVSEELQSASAEALSKLLMFEDNRKLFACNCPRGCQSLEAMLGQEDIHELSWPWPYTRRCYSAVCLTLLDSFEDPHRKFSAEEYFGRGWGKSILGEFDNAVKEFDKALEMTPTITRALAARAAAKVHMGHTDGALEDLDRVRGMEKFKNDSFCYQERGVVKRIKGDYEGSLSDFDIGNSREPLDYDLLKHRGYTKFLLGDETGAKADAERALLVMDASVFSPYYATNRHFVLGYWSVEYLGYHFR
ncbi:hypothetical protein Mapa_011270 [Marchantia paleacea]|nr:hypothetical protein Mapa_011270 [Marchantia paleacea]